VSSPAIPGGSFAACGEPTQVTVKIEVSPDQKQWKTILEGSGVKQPQ
jgi:hypothetical protein